MKRTKSTYLALVAVLLSPMTAVATPIELNGHYYDYVSGVLSWEEAQAAALASSHLGISGYLATITSLEENTLLYNLLVEAGGVGGWIGGSDAASEGSFYWVDGPEAGQAFSYMNWDTNPVEPNNCCGGEDFVQLTTRNQGGWNDLNSTGTYSLSGYFVEYSSVPEPGTLALLGLGLVGMAARRRKKV